MFPGWDEDVTRLLYQLFELNHAALSPWRAAAKWGAAALGHESHPLYGTELGRTLAASCEFFETSTRRYGKPEFGLSETKIGSVTVPVCEEVVHETPFCRLLHFKREESLVPEDARSRLMIVAPLSGHYATLLRGTVEALLPSHDVYITDWADARMVPLSEGAFDLDDYIDHVRDFCAFLGEGTHLLAVCQPSVPVLAATALMNEDGDVHAPRSITLMGGPIDTRVNPTEVNNFATAQGYDWFASNVIMSVPWPHPGHGREVYPGFLQLSGFMAMNINRHVTAHWDYFTHLVDGDGSSATKHRDFYDEYLAVMDLPAEYYLQTIRRVFVEHHLPRGLFAYRGRKVDLTKISRTGLMTVEGEKDDISGVGQTLAAQVLCKNIPDDMRAHHEQEGVGHYGVFNGTRWEEEIEPLVSAFIKRQDARA